jgi:REP element-mobilizing transposase RayT
MNDELKYYSPQAETTVGRNRLPHWDQQGRTYSLTFRLADSVPADLMKQHRLEEAAWREHHPEPWTAEVELEYLRRFTGAIERWLDQGHGDCLLRLPACAAIVANALRHFEGQRTRLHAWVVMPNHVHVLTEILEGHQLSDLMESWKGYMARAVNAHLGRTGTLWQKGYHDRLIRNREHFDNVVRYFRQNPIKAGLKPGEWLAGESALASSVPTLGVAG